MASIGFVSLGCPKALVDSEHIITSLQQRGYAISPNYQDADLVIVNTCGFIDAAVTESLDAIGEALKDNGRVIVTGCLGKRENSAGDNLVATVHPRILGVTGPHQTQEVMDLVSTHLPIDRPTRPIHLPAQGTKLTPKHYAYLKISEGCSHSCSFCIIPDLRGPLVSRPLKDILAEAKILLDAGVKELLVVSQDTSAYGVDRKNKAEFIGTQSIRANFPNLVEQLSVLAAPYAAWVRLHYVYPYPSVKEVIPLFGKVVVPYLDMPLQHAHPEVLKRMKRPANSEKMLERISEWRAQCPDLVLRSTFIAGFPSETATEFQALLDFLPLAQIDRLGCFAYSPVEGAQANALEGALSDEVRAARRDQVMLVQRDISAARLHAKIGRTMRVLVDELVQDDTGVFALTRSAGDAPEIDGNVIVARPPRHWHVGDWREVTVIDANEYDLIAQVGSPGVQQSPSASHALPHTR